MKIKTIEVIPFRIPYAIPVKISTGLLASADNVLVKIIAENGLIGIGETQPLPPFQGCSETQNSIVQVIKNKYIPILLGQDPANIERIMEDLDASVRGCSYAVTAVSDGLYDLFAKSLNIPLYKLLGGLYRNKIEMVWSIGMKSTAEMEKEARWALGQGYRKLKIKVGSANPKDDVEHAFAVRKVLGEDISFRIDANAGYTFIDALNAIKAMKGVNLEFIEQPLPIWDYDGLAKLSALIDIPIMADESCNTIQSVVELVKRMAVAICDIKLAKNGGIFHARKIAAITQAANIPLYAGNQPATSIGAAAAAHFYGATPNVIAGDFNIGPAGWISGDIVKRPLVLDGPFAIVPDGIGIGVELDESKLAKYTVSL
jgi:L-alanine-DL-glutamate epimerase-like enolase superfamily enzyme